MDDVFRVSRFESPTDAECLIEVDSYVPLRFRTYARPLGSSYLRVGDRNRSLIEFLVDPNIGLLRGITLTSFADISEWPGMAMCDRSQGLPVFELSWGKANRIDVDREFRVSVRDGEILVYWDTVTQCDAATFSRVQFLSVGGHLSGVKFAKFAPDEIKTLTSHVQGR